MDRKREGKGKSVEQEVKRPRVQVEDSDVVSFEQLEGILNKAHSIFVIHIFTFFCRQVSLW